MTDPERTQVAEALLAVIFSLRTDNGDAGLAWTLSIATTAMSRAVLASVGIKGDPTEVLNVAFSEVGRLVNDAQTRVIRETLTAGVHQ